MADSMENLLNTSWEWKGERNSVKLSYEENHDIPSIIFAYFPQGDIFGVMLTSYRVLQKSYDCSAGNVSLRTN